MFSNTTEYALRAVMHLASAPDKPRAAKEIAESAQIPSGYVSKVLQDLARAGILTSRRGPSGGFRLARPPSRISVLEVINAVDPIKRILHCPLNLPEHARKLCRLHQQLDDAIATVEKTLAQATFADMLESDRRARDTSSRPSSRRTPEPPPRLLDSPAHPTAPPPRQPSRTPMSILTNVLDTLGLGHGLPDPLPANPFPLLRTWHDDAGKDKRIADANAMVLATSTPDAAPSARVVLCKSIEESTGSLVFFTSYASRKGRELEANPRAACVFYWEPFGRQARVEGRIERVSEKESDDYFATRPLLSRIGASASLQSQPMAKRTDLLDRVLHTIKEMNIPVHQLLLPGAGPKIPRPAAWGGYRLHARRVELWAASKGRLHDRAVWSRSDAAQAWTSARLFP